MEIENLLRWGNIRCKLTTNWKKITLPLFWSLNTTQIVFRYFVIIILYCKTIHPVIFFQQHTFFYSIYFIIQYNIELIFANTSIIEYWFFSDVEHFCILLSLYLKKKITPRTSMILVFLFRKQNYSKIKVYCKQNCHVYRDFFEGFQIFF